MTRQYYPPEPARHARTRARHNSLRCWDVRTAREARTADDRRRAPATVAGDEYGVPVPVWNCRAPRSAVPGSARSRSFVAFLGDESVSPGIAPALPRGSARDAAGLSRSALRGHGLRAISLVRRDSGRRRACRPESLLHSREAPPVTLAGLVELFATDPTVTEAIGDARSRTLPALDLTAPPAMRPLIAAALAAATEAGGADRPVLLVTSTYREAENLAAACRSLVGERGRRLLPGLGDVAARAAEPTVRHRRAPARGAASPGRQRRAAAAQDHRGPRPLGAPAPGQGPWRHGPGPARRRPGLRHRRARPGTGRGGVRAGGHGRAAGRVRRPRWDRGHLPAHRGAPGPGRLLRRRGRGDPLLHGRRPALVRPDPDRDHRLTLPRAAAHRRRTSARVHPVPGRIPS